MTNYLRVDKIGLLVILLLLALPVSGQKDWDYIFFSDFYLLKSDSVINGKIRIKPSELYDSIQAEKLFGNDYKVKRYYDLLFGEYLTDIKYPAGLKMTFGETPKKYLFTFEIDSKEYSLLLKNGKEIKLGMKVAEFDSLFHKSFLKRTIYKAPDPRKGKASLIVFIGLKKGSEIIYAAEWFIFTFSDFDGILERITLFIPG